MQMVNNFVEFHFKVPSQRKDIILAFKSLLKTFKILNLPNQNSNDEKDDKLVKLESFAGSMKGDGFEEKYNEYRKSKYAKQNLSWHKFITNSKPSLCEKFLFKWNFCKLLSKSMLLYVER